MSNFILVVENEALVREALVDILHLAGLKTIEAENGHAAIRAFHTYQKSIGLVIMDMYLSDMDGTQLLPELEAIQNDVPVIVASGEDERKLVKKFSNHPNVVIIMKPYDIDGMLNQVGRMLLR